MYANSSHAFVKTVTALLTTQQSKLEHLVFLTKNGGCSAQLVRHASGNIDNSLGKLSYSWPNKAEEQQRKVRARKRTLNERNLQSTSTFLWRLQQHENLSPKSRLTCTDRKCQWSMLFFWGSSYVSRFICVFPALPLKWQILRLFTLTWRADVLSCAARSTDRYFDTDHSPIVSSTMTLDFGAEDRQDNRHDVWRQKMRMTFLQTDPKINRSKSRDQSQIHEIERAKIAESSEGLMQVVRTVSCRNSKRINLFSLPS